MDNRLNRAWLVEILEATSKADGATVLLPRRKSKAMPAILFAVGIAIGWFALPWILQYMGEMPWLMN